MHAQGPASDKGAKVCKYCTKSVQTVEHDFLQVILGSVQLIVWNTFCNACKYTGFNVSDKMRKYCARQ